MVHIQSELHIQWFDYILNQVAGLSGRPYHMCNNSQNQLEGIGKAASMHDSVDPRVSVPIPRNGQPSGR